MEKLVLLSLLMATMLIPHRLARIEPRAKGYKKLKLWTAIMCLVYIFLLIYIYPRVAK